MRFASVLGGLLILCLGDLGAAAIPTPNDGIDAGKLNLWTYDSYHASTPGYYLQALVIFGTLTGLDPRSLGDNECSGYELGMSRAEVKSLQQVAFDQPAAAMTITAAPAVSAKPAPRHGVASRRINRGGFQDPVHSGVTFVSAHGSRRLAALACRV